MQNLSEHAVLPSVRSVTPGVVQGLSAVVQAQRHRATIRHNARKAHEFLSDRPPRRMAARRSSVRRRQTQLSVYATTSTFRWGSRAKDPGATGLRPGWNRDKGPTQTNASPFAICLTRLSGSVPGIEGGELVERPAFLANRRRARWAFCLPLSGSNAVLTRGPGVNDGRQRAPVSR